MSYFFILPSRKLSKLTEIIDIRKSFFQLIWKKRLFEWYVYIFDNLHAGSVPNWSLLMVVMPTSVKDIVHRYVKL